MAAITGDPLPPGARADAAALAEHRSAVSDVALLREQLGLIAQALTEPPAAGRAPAPAPGPAPARPRAPRPRRRPLALVLGTLAAACAAAVATGLGGLPLGADGDTGEASGVSAADAGAKTDAPASGVPGLLACARLVAEGTVTALERVPGTGRYRVTLEVTRSYRPAEGDGRAAFTLEDAPARLRAGDEVLVVLPRHGSVPDALFVGEREIAPERAAVGAARPASPEPSCT
ncbi:hypothetical protein TU94_11440 [Streptomyces cyaneogriseus subsp. noncyanogenus]|uniref:Uncharacterized protein n=2 Tax=Streptomyces cyaneogriseus TaxID=68192 RepID=A0A0C5GBC7_9ACTN|nr:hypothetical protein TU94_11440 [Streptomyces cyaneogriseus subsp. noncyanogenus]